MSSKRKEETTFRLISSVGCIHVYSEDGSTVAEASNMTTDNTYYLNRVYVKPNQRGKGMGSRALDVMLREMRLLDATLYCEIIPYGDLDFNTLRLWYIRHGFKEYDKDGNKILIFNYKEDIGNE